MNMRTLPSGGGHIDGLRRAGRPSSSMTNAGLAVTLAFVVGTGGVVDARYFQKRQERGYAFAAIRITDEAPASIPRTPAENLERVRSVFKPAMSALADLFGVSRQAIYNWVHGEQPKSEYAERLDDLARAADVIAAEGIGDSGQALKRKIADGRTLLEIVAAGGSAQDAAHNLAVILRREAEQRKQLEARLAGRRPASEQIDPYGSPMLDERA